MVQGQPGHKQQTPPKKQTKKQKNLGYGLSGAQALSSITSTTKNTLGPYKIKRKFMTVNRFLHIQYLRLWGIYFSFLVTHST
jgi:hypothetical protein